jgi:acyl-CoA dehydrogenase
MVLGTAMPLIMSAYLGVADAAVDLAAASAAGRNDAATVGLMGELTNLHVAAVDAVDGMFRDAADLTFDNVDGLTARILARKSNAVDALVESVAHAAEVIGGAGYGRGSVIERLQRDIGGCRHHPLPKARQIQLSGRVALGLAPV